MNRSEERWLKFKQERITILFLCTIQILLNFTFPPFSRLGFPLSIIFPTIFSFVTACCYIYIFFYIDKLAPWMNLKYSNDEPDSLVYVFKNIERMIFIVISHMGVFLAWYYNMYDIAGIYYIIYYLYFIIVFILIYRAVKRSQT